MFPHLLNFTIKKGRVSFGQPTHPSMYLHLVVRNKSDFFYKEVSLLLKNDTTIVDSIFSGAV